MKRSGLFCCWLASLAFLPLGVRAERNPFSPPGPMPQVMAGGAVSASTLPPLPSGMPGGVDDKVWDTVDLVALSKDLILLRQQGASSTLAIEPGRPFRMAGEAWVAELAQRNQVRIWRAQGTRGTTPAANLWLAGGPPRIVGNVSSNPAGGAGAGQPNMPAAAPPVVPAGGGRRVSRCPPN